MKKIVICSSPRCGTHLLLTSLASHSLAKSAGEVLNPEDGYSDFKLSRDRSIHIRQHNLFKLLVLSRSLPDFGKYNGFGFRVFMFRRDVEAQIDSWQRACATGRWTAQEPVSNRLKPVIPRAEMRRQIGIADDLFLRSSDLVISYEELVENWDDSIMTILDRAGWPIECLSMALQKMG
ncbi:hypothetical protein [Rhodopirellula halodulae]|uniref:hypothetical protein n=1 Tax=Rhodopirellula halodulae TaxID=2894198 RepID=UPI001E293782|nr:hypothetical protein [Rhodopirellula sp. JC737]MCC9655275.1 hypothetical protein [Rhodopirellula sp. JC737]